MGLLDGRAAEQLESLLLVQLGEAEEEGTDQLQVDPVLLHVPHSLQVVLPVQLNTQQRCSISQSRLCFLPEGGTGDNLPLALVAVEQRIELLALNLIPICLCQIDLFLV